MWQFVSLALLIAVALADPQRSYRPPGNGYLPPSPRTCDPVESVVYTTQIASSLSVTTQVQTSTQFRVVTSYQTQVVPITRYQTRVLTRTQYQTSVLQSQSQVISQQLITSTQQAPAVYQTRYATSVRIVPQVSYVTREQVQTQVVPVEVTSTRFETRFSDLLQYTTSQIVSNTLVQIPGRDVYRTAYDIRYQTSTVQVPGPAQTQYVTTTRVVPSIVVQTQPAAPVFRTSIVTSQQVIPTVVVNTRYETQTVTQTRYVTMTQIQAQTQVQTQYVTQEVVVTQTVPREVYRTQYTTRFVPTTIVSTVVSTVFHTQPPVFRTQISHYQSIVRVPGPNSVVTSQIVTTQQTEEVVYSTEVVQRPVTETQTITATCSEQGYNYPEPSVPFSG